MQAERWRQIQDLFDAAADLEPLEASAYLANHCPDVNLRSEVEALIRNSAGAEAFFAAGSSAIGDDLCGEPEPGERVGPYEIIRRIGRGGMGSVFLAARADGEFQKQVAIKVMRSGLASPTFLRQFQAERQMLARLDHPHIARLLDAGLTTSGLPYVIMEHVEGLPITTWCDKHRKSIEERLLLFRSVCAAVHHAHQHLVVHGDIKPGNIFVTPEGLPKLLDFGVGKLLEEAEPETKTAAGLLPQLLTPEYASPEQRRGETLTTSSDIYSLGVLLAELLTGRLPCPPAHGSSQAPSSMELGEEAAASRKTTRPKLGRLLRGDLDAIVLAALREEPKQRYASAERFSDDIRRYLSGLPVSANSHSSGYRAGKFIRRHKLGFSAACLLSGALIAMAVLAKERHDETTRRLAVVTALALDDQVAFNDTIQELPGTLQIRLERATHNLDYLEQSLQEAPGDLEIQRAVIYCYRRIGLIHYGRFRQHLGNSQAAIDYARKSLEGYERLAGQPIPPGPSLYGPLVDVQTRTPGQILHAYAQLGDALVLTRRDFAAAEELHKKEEAAITRIFGGKEGVVREADWQTAHLALRRAREAVQRNAPDEAIRYAEESIGRLGRMIKRYPYDEDYALYQSYGYLAMSQALLMQGKSAKAAEKLALARPELEQWMERRPAGIPPQAYWVSWSLTTASAEAQQGRCQDAMSEAARALELARSLARLDPVSKFTQETLAGALYSSGVTLKKCGRFTEARDQLQSAIQSWDALVRHDPKNAEWQYQLEKSRAAHKLD